MKKKPRLALLGMLGLVVLGASSYFAYDSYESKRLAERAAVTAQASEQQRQQRAQAQREAQAQILRSLKDPGPSQWLEQGRAPLWRALAKSTARVVVVPPSNPEDVPGLDITARVTFARALADSIAMSDAVPDPGFVFAALGEPRTIDENVLLRRLEGTQIQSVVTGSLAVESGRVALKLQRIDLSTKQRSAYQGKVDIADVNRPEQSLVGVAADATRALGFEPASTAGHPIDVRPELALPSSPLAAATEGSDAPTGIWLQQLFAVLHSPIFLADPRAQERLFERSLWSVSELGAFADRAVLEARALAYLGRREAALRSLDAAPAGAEHDALKAYLNADLPALEKALADVHRPVPRLIGQLELMAVREAAGVSTRESRRADAQRILGALPEPWHPLIALYALSFDPWDYPASAVVKGVLERDFPVPDYRIQDVMLGKAALGSSPYDPKVAAELALSPLVHVRKWREQHVDELCCIRPAARSYRPTPTDYLDLLENSADALMLGHLYFLREVQGNRDEALATIKLYDELQFAGSHPGVLLQKGSAYIRTSRQPPSAWKDDEVFEAARRIKAWTPYQSKAAAWAGDHWARTAGQPAAARGFYGAYTDELLRPAYRQPLAGDFPPRDVFLVDIQRFVPDTDPGRRIEKELLRKACAIAVYYFGPCGGYAQLVRSEGDEAERKQVNDLLAQRFAGYADAANVKVAYLRDDGRNAEAEAILREVLKSSPSQEVYAELGNMLSDEGRFEEAAKTYGSLPELKSSGSNTVGLSNYLHDASRRLLARGAGLQARALVERAASYGDGSQANLQARVYVALWQGQGELALQRLRDLYRRYPDPRSIADIAGLMFALGQDEAAWAALKSVGPNPSDFSPFAAAIIGLRRERGGVPQTMARIESLGGKPYVFTAATAFQVFAVDRTPEALDLFWQAESSLRLKDPNNYSHGMVFGQMLMSTTEDNALALRATVDGYRHLLRGNAAAAADALWPLVERFDKTGVPQGFEGPDNLWAMLPYTAYALAKAGRRDDAAKLLEHFDEQHQRAAGRQKIMVKKAPDFESSLVRAILAALAGDHAKGLQELRLAQARMPEGGQTRLIPQNYEFAELAEWLGRDTGNAAYFAAAVDFARGYQLYQPFAAWTYAIEAAYARDQRSRVRAAGMAMWIDPDSRRVQSLPATVRNGGKSWLQSNRPFRKPVVAKRETKA